MAYELLTGATGLLGGYLLKDALESGRQVAVLVRSTVSESAQERLYRSLRNHGWSGSFDSLKILEGDLHRPDLGLDTVAREWVAQHCCTVLHNAAVVKFQAQGNSGEPYLTNVDGTRHLLRLCQETGIEDFHLVSTAYLGGTGPEPFLESEFDSGQTFSNDYERSKFIAEYLVRTAPFLKTKTIYRPSVIMGDSITGFSSNFQGMYSLLRLAWLLVRHPREAVFEYMEAADDDTFNLVPVDWVSDAIRKLQLQTPTELGTYHLTNPSPVSAGELYQAVSRAPAPPEMKLSTAQQILKFYAPYVVKHRTFDSSRTQASLPDLPCPEVKGECLERMVRFAVERNFQSRSGPSPLTHIERLPESKSSPTLTLEVAGEEAKCWHLCSQNGRDLFLTELGPAPARAFCREEVLSKLVAGELALEAALYSGALVLEAPPKQLTLGQHTLQSLLDRLGRSSNSAGGDS